MIDREEMTDVAFELLKLLFFVVTYFLIVSDLSMSVSLGSAGKLQYTGDFAIFYNTLFIFSATTWIDYLSLMKDSIRDGYIFTGKYSLNPRICLIGACVGFATTFISLMCVFFKSDKSFINWGACVYWGSLFFLGLKAYVISDIVLQIKKDWSRKKSVIGFGIKISILLVCGLIPFILRSWQIISTTGLYETPFLLMLYQKLIPYVVITSLMAGIVINDIVFYHSIKVNNNEFDFSSPKTDGSKFELTEQNYLDIQNETDGKMPYDDIEFNWIIDNYRRSDQEKKTEQSEQNETGNL